MMRYGKTLARWNSLVLLVVILWGLTVGHFALGESYIVKKGQPQADIVIADNPLRAVRLAAAELQTYIESITGARLAIATSPQADAAFHIYVGKSAHTDRLKITDEGLKYGAFRMVSGKDWLVLLGHDTDSVLPRYTPRNQADGPRALKEWDERTGEKWGNPVEGTTARWATYSAAVGMWEYDEHGSLNAVYRFLYDQGVRWYMPGELGEVLPKLKSIALAPLDKTVKPDFPYRHFWSSPTFQNGTRDAILYKLRIGLEPIMDIPGPHGLNDVNGRDEVKKAHPEYFALYGGKRATEGDYFASCLSSPGLFESTVKYARTVCDIYPDLQYVSIWPNDGFGMCQCELCKGKDTPKRGGMGVASDYVWDFTERVAKELYKTHPDRKVIGGAYGEYTLPPEKIARFSPNVMVGIVQRRQDFNNAEKRARALEIRKAYVDRVATGNLYIYNHYLSSYGERGLPAYFPHVIAEDLRSLKGLSQGEFIELSQAKDAHGMDAPGFNHLNVYVTARYYWDAGQDVDKMLDEYYALFYGPAAREMKAFIEYSERNWTLMPAKVEPIDRALALLEAARKSAGDTVYGRRIDLVRDYVRPLKDIQVRLAMNRKDVPRTHSIWNIRNSEITIDGRLDDPRWKEGTINGWNSYTLGLAELETGRRAFSGTSFRVIWGERAIFFGISCADRDMKALNIATTNDDDAAIFKGDYVEVLLETQGHSYYQIAVNPAGAVFDADMQGGTNTAWASSANVAVYKGDTFWSVEMRIPVGDAIEGGVDPMKSVEGRSPSELYPWAFNVCRQRVRSLETERYAWSPTGTNSFHVPLKFGVLSDNW